MKFNAEPARQRILEELARAQQRNSRYTLRAFAKKLGISASATSEIINGKRNFSKKMAVRLLERLLIAPQEQSLLIGLPVGSTLGRNTLSPYVELSHEDFKLVSEWQYFAILSLAETSGFRSEAHWIANRLGLSVTKTEETIKGLVRANLLKCSEAGQLTATGRRYSTPDSKTKNLAIRKLQNANLTMAKEALETFEASERDFTALTLSFDPSRLDEAKRLIRNFQDQFEAFATQGARNEVFKLCFQFFPLSQNNAAHPRTSSWIHK